jgi:hypothetical protein
LCNEFSFFTRNGANKIFSSDSLKIAWNSVLLSNPLPKDDFLRFHEFRFTVSCLFAKGGPDQGEDLQQPALVPTRLGKRDRIAFAIAAIFAAPSFGPVASEETKLGRQIQEGI